MITIKFNLRYVTVALCRFVTWWHSETSICTNIKFPSASGDGDLWHLGTL